MIKIGRQFKYIEKLNQFGLIFEKQIFFSTFILKLYVFGDFMSIKHIDSASFKQISWIVFTDIFEIKDAFMNHCPSLMKVTLHCTRSQEQPHSFHQSQETFFWKLIHIDRFVKSRFGSLNSTNFDWYSK